MNAIIDGRMSKKAKARLSERFSLIELPPYPLLDKRVASHPDMLMLYSSGKLFVCKDYLMSSGDILKIDGTKIIECDVSLKSEYPFDIAFNSFISSKCLFGSIRYTARELLDFSCEQGINQCNVKQGYSKCSTVVLGDDGIITADKSIYEAYKKISGNALLISPDGVALNGYDRGFIGGASGVCNKEVFFCGDIGLHPDSEKIIDFCNDLGYTVTSLSDEPLYDVGTIIFI